MTADEIVKSLLAECEDCGERFRCDAGSPLFYCPNRDAANFITAAHTRIAELEVKADALTKDNNNLAKHGGQYMTIAEQRYELYAHALDTLDKMKVESAILQARIAELEAEVQGLRANSMIQEQIIKDGGLTRRHKMDWISVKDGLPEFEQRAVISWGDYEDIAVYRRGMLCPHWKTQHYGTVDLMCVTHWMPIPQLPKEDE